MKLKSMLLYSILLFVGLVQVASASNFLSLMSSSNPAELSALIQSHSIFYYWLIFFGIGIFLAFTPCVLPMVPILSGVIAKQGSQQTKRSALLAFYYVMGMAVSYAIAGMLAGYLGSSLQSMLQTPLVIIAFSLLMILMGLALLDMVQLKMPQALSKLMPQTQTKSSALGIFMMGAISTLVVSPCVTAPLIGILTFISQSGQVMLGGSVLFVMALGMGLPLILFAAGQGALLPKAGSWMVIIKILFAYMMFGISLWLSSRVLSTSVIQIAYIALVFAFIIHLASSINSTTKTALKGGICLSLTVFGTLMLWPLVKSQSVTPTKSAQVEFTQMTQPKPLKEALIAASSAHKPVFLEFHASWCEDCVAMENKVFNDPAVISALGRFERLQVDVSDNTPTVALLKKAYHVYGTPMLLFYDSKGQALTSLNAAGFVNRDAFLTLLKKVN